MKYREVCLDPHILESMAYDTFLLYVPSKDVSLLFSTNSQRNAWCYVQIEKAWWLSYIL